MSFNTYFLSIWIQLVKETVMELSKVCVWAMYCFQINLLFTGVSVIRRAVKVCCSHFIRLQTSSWPAEVSQLHIQNQRSTRTVCALNYVDYVKPNCRNRLPFLIWSKSQSQQSILTPTLRVYYLKAQLTWWFKFCCCFHLFSTPHGFTFGIFLSLLRPNRFELLLAQLF